MHLRAIQEDLHFSIFYFYYVYGTTITHFAARLLAVIPMMKRGSTEGKKIAFMRHTSRQHKMLSNRIRIGNQIQLRYVNGSFGSILRSFLTKQT